MAGVSFYPTKTLGASGDGGMVFCDSPEWAQRLVRLTHHGMPEPYLHELVAGHVGANSRLDAMQAAVLLAHLEDLPERVALRRKHAAIYDAELPSWVRRLPRWAGHPVHQYVVRVPNRDALRRFLSAESIETAIYYPLALSAQPALSGCPRLPTPNADAFSAESLALPVHECLTEGDIQRILQTFRSFTP
jgi:dTDP-4-amino-4,6-dideoxygalactose transaminase